MGNEATQAAERQAALAVKYQAALQVTLAEIPWRPINEAKSRLDALEREWQRFLDLAKAAIANKA